MCSSSDFHPAMPTQFCNLLYRSIMYWNLQLSCLKSFPILYIFLYCTVNNFYHAHGIYIIYCSRFPICVFIWVAEWQHMRIVELMSTGDGQIMETLDSIGIKLFVLAALKEH